MLIKSGSVRLYASCDQIYEALTGSRASTAFGGMLRIEGDRARIVLRGEHRDRVVELRVASRRVDGGARLELVNELGVQCVLMSVECREEGGKCFARYEIALNPTGLGVSANIVNLTLMHMLRGFEERLRKAIREMLRHSPALGERFLREDFATRVVAKARILERRRMVLRDVVLSEIAARYPRNQIYVATSGEPLFRAVVLDGLYDAYLRLGVLEYRGERAVAKARERGEEVLVTVYSIDDLVQP